MTSTLNDPQVADINETHDEIAEVSENNTYVTVYQCAAIVNEWLKTHNILDENTESGFKELSPQMFYNYTKKGYITQTFIEGGRYVNVEDLKSWYVGYVTKPKTRKTTKISIEAPELPSA